MLLSRHRLAVIIALLMLSTFIMACRSEAPIGPATATAPAAVDEQGPVSADAQPAGEAYPPPPAATPSGGPYPPPSPTLVPVDAYPAETDEPSGVLLALNQPVQAGDTTVTGVGPAGITVFIRSITNMGTELGQAVIGDDGTFSVEVPPLEENIRVGLTTGAADTIQAGIRPAEGAMSVPQVGYFYDSARVTP